MESDVIGSTAGPDLDPARIMERAQAAGLKGVVVLGHDENGDEYMATSYSDIRGMLWLLRRAEHVLMTIADESIGEGE